MKLKLLVFCCLLSVTVTAQQNKNSIFKEALHYQTLFDNTLREDVSCYRIPSLITAPNGDLIAACDERVSSCKDLKWNNDINIVIRRSTDNGKTWQKKQTVIDYPYGQSASDPSMIVDKITGEIFLFFNYMDLEKEKNSFYHRFIKSADNGKTWSSPIDISSQITNNDWKTNNKFITSGKGTQTHSGKLLHTLVNLQKGLFVFGSDDHGKTWFVIDNPIHPADESIIAELSDGSWMINSRVQKKGCRYVHLSTDEGKTWISKPDSVLSDPGCNASFIRYSSNNSNKKKSILLFSNANSSKERKNLTLRISADNGKSWSNGLTIYEGSTAYSSITILKNGDIGLLFEKDNYHEITFVSIPFKRL